MLLVVAALPEIVTLVTSRSTVPEPPIHRPPPSATPPSAPGPPLVSTVFPLSVLAESEITEPGEPVKVEAGALPDAAALARALDGPDPPLALTAFPETSAASIVMLRILQTAPPSPTPPPDPSPPLVKAEFPRSVPPWIASTLSPAGEL